MRSTGSFAMPVERAARPLQRLPWIRLRRSIGSAPSRGRAKRVGGGSVHPDLDLRMLIDAHRAEEQRHEPMGVGEHDHAVLAAARQHPVQQVARGHEVQAHQLAAGDVDQAGFTDLAGHQAQLVGDVAAELAHQLQLGGPVDRILHIGVEEAGLRVDRHRARRRAVGRQAVAADTHPAFGTFPGRRRHLIGHAVVDRGLVELVGPVDQPQGLQPQHPQGRVGVTLADGRELLELAQETVTAQPALIDLLLGPEPEQLAQLDGRVYLDAIDRIPVEHPGHRQGLAALLQQGHILGGELGRCRPTDLAGLGHRRAPGLAGGLGDQLGHREPLRRGQAELLGVLDRQHLELALGAGGPVVVEQHQPGLAVQIAAAARAHELGERALAGVVVGVRERDDGLVQLRIVDEFLHLDRRRGLGQREGQGHVQRRQLGQHAGRRIGQRRNRRAHGYRSGRRGGGEPLGLARARELADTATRLHARRHGHGGREGGRAGAGLEEAGLLIGHGLRRCKALAHHLLLDLVDLGLHAEIDLRVGFADALILAQARGRRGQGRQLLGRQALTADPAQHVELALAHEIIAALALDHRAQLGLGEVALRVVLTRVDLGPVRRRVRDKARHLAEETVAFLGVCGLGVGHGRWRGQSPNIFCLSSRRCCASSDSVAVGRAIRRPRPMGSPVSSQKP
mmetsp:Transcript_5838/g.22817  ORF Transcript_5838/g.22817 Transcript_5838/m.22817 type:complete len:679 (-) Transcript_5838:6880-8916(-)